MVLQLNPWLKTDQSQSQWPNLFLMFHQTSRNKMWCQDFMVAFILFVLSMLKNFVILSMLDIGETTNIDLELS